MFVGIAELEVDVSSMSGIFISSSLSESKDISHYHDTNLPDAHEFE